MLIRRYVRLFGALCQWFSSVLDPLKTPIPFKSFCAPFFDTHSYEMLQINFADFCFFHFAEGSCQNAGRMA